MAIRLGFSQDKAALARRPCRDSAAGLGFTLQHRLRRAAKDEHASVRCGSTIATCATLLIPIANLGGIFRLASVPIKLLLEIGLGVDGSTERTHRDLEFPTAKCADCDDRGRAKPFDDSKIALFRRLVHLNHRTREFGCIQECIQFRFQFHLFWTVFLIVSGLFSSWRPGVS
jgi:hypothetical protein